MSDIISTAKDFQTAIVGAVGFAGVIMTLVVNARIARQARREITAAELRSLRISLIAELKVLKIAYIEGERSFRATPPDVDCAVPKTRLDIIFRANVPKLGLLTPHELHRVLDAYLSDEQVYTQLNFLAKPSTRDEVALYIPRSKCVAAANMYHQIIGLIENAMSAITTYEG